MSGECCTLCMDVTLHSSLQLVYTCVHTGVSEVLLSSCDNVLYEVPYSSPVVEDHGRLMVTNFRLIFVPYQPANTEPVSCTAALV